MTRDMKTVKAKHQLKAAGLRSCSFSCPEKRALLGKLRNLLAFWSVLGLGLSFITYCSKTFTKTLAALPVCESRISC